MDGTRRRYRPRLARMLVKFLEDVQEVAWLQRQGGVWECEERRMLHSAEQLADALARVVEDEV